MSALNKTTSSEAVTNIAGGKGFKRTNPYNTFLSIVMNCLNNSDNYYKSNKQVQENLEILLDELDKEFIAKSVIFLREELGFRYISKVLANYLIKTAKSEKYLKPMLIRSFIRVNDMTDQFAISGRANSLRRAMKYCLENKFNLYQFKKYTSINNQVKLKDIVKLSRPNPNKFKFDKQGLDDVYKAIIEDRLPNINTAQTLNAGKVKYTFDNIKDLGYMALIKNIRKILTESPELYDYIIERIQDKNQIQKSMILPFRFYDCMESIQDIKFDQFKLRELTKTLFYCMKLSAEQLELDGVYALCLDESGSMDGTPFKYGKVLTSILMSDKSVAYTWASHCKFVVANPMDFLMNRSCNGGGTYAEEPLKELIRTKTLVDTIFIFTDMELYGDSSLQKYYNQYKNNVNPNVKLVLWNLAPYGDNTPIRFTKDVVEINSCSDKLIPYIGKILKNPNYIIDKINSIEL